MQANTHRWLAAFLAAALCAAAPAWAEKPEHAGGTRKAKTARADDDVADPKARQRDDVGKGERMGARLKPGAYIGERHRVAVRKAWQREYGSGKRCPPGLAKKANGCQAPGQARQWTIGEPLPAGAEARPVPQPLLVHLPRTPAGHRYVLLAGDILLIAAGSKMVVDGIDGLLGR